MKNLIKLLLIMSISINIYANEVKKYTVDELTKTALEARDLAQNKDFNKSITKFDEVILKMSENLKIEEDKVMRNTLLEIRAALNAELANIYLMTKEINKAEIAIDKSFKDISSVQNNESKRIITVLRGNIKYLLNKNKESAESFEKSLETFKKDKELLETMNLRIEFRKKMTIVSSILNNYKTIKDYENTNKYYGILISMVDNFKNFTIKNKDSIKTDQDREDDIKLIKILEKTKTNILIEQKKFNESK